jgi:malate synthase
MSISASLFDFGLTIFHIARSMPTRPSVAHFSLAKLESGQEARLWADIFRFAEQHLGIAQGFIRVMVAIDTISAASEMDEVLFELRDYVAALECSPVSYLASFVRSFRAHGESLLPQRSDISMNQPFLQAYQELLVHTCLKHNVRAISSGLQQFGVADGLKRNDREEARISLEIQHEIELGFDGICLADPDLIPAALSTFKQTARRRRPTGPAIGKCHITARDLISPSLGRITMMALKENVESALVYLEAWLAGHGSALGARGLKSMASAELCRAQLWQWVRHSARLTGGHRVSRYVIECLIRDSLASIETQVGGPEFAASRFLVAAEVLLSSCTDDFDSPLALRAYAHLC